MAQQPLMGQGLLIIEASQSLSVRHTTVGRTPLDEWSARRRPLPDNTQHWQETDIHAFCGIQPTVPATERPQTHASDRSATGIGLILYRVNRWQYKWSHKHASTSNTE
jgi:hypothetical protein